MSAILLQVRADKARVESDLAGSKEEVATLRKALGEATMAELEAKAKLHEELVRMRQESEAVKARFEKDLAGSREEMSNSEKKVATVMKELGEAKSELEAKAKLLEEESKVRGESEAVKARVESVLAGSKEEVATLRKALEEATKAELEAKAKLHEELERMRQESEAVKARSEKDLAGSREEVSKSEKKVATVMKELGEAKSELEAKAKLLEEESKGRGEVEAIRAKLERDSTLEIQRLQIQVEALSAQLLARSEHSGRNFGGNSFKFKPPSRQPVGLGLGQQFTGQDQQHQQAQSGAQTVRLQHSGPNPYPPSMGLGQQPMGLGQQPRGLGQQPYQPPHQQQGSR